MSLLESHLEQISLSSRAITDLPFPPAGRFTNAILGNHDITTLIRDTETHERALFQLHSDAESRTSRRATRRGTMFPGDVDGSMYPRQQSAVARVLGGDMVREIEKSTANARTKQSANYGGINVEVLLRGAEKLCRVYPVEGAAAKIASLRNRYSSVAQSIAQYEARVTQQTEQMGRINRNQDFASGYQVDEEEDMGGELVVTEEDLIAEEQEIQELEARKRALEERVSGMEKDLGGLLR